MGQVRTPAILVPLVSATTYRRGVHLLLGAVILLPYLLLAALFVRLLTDDTRPHLVALLFLVVTVVIGALPAFLRGARELEIAAARFLLDADLPEPAPDRSARLAVETRIRSALWFAVHLFTGGVVAVVLLIAVPMALVFLASRVGLDAGVTRLRFGPLDEIGPLHDHDTWWWSLIGLILLVVTVYAVAGLGALAALMAPVLLGPSQAERIAALEAGSRRLAERNRIARDLHDSIGHALTAATLQAAAARELFDTDPAFARRALEIIEEVGRAAIDDLDHVLGVLREPGRDGTGDGAARRPQPTLDDLDRLCEEARTGGVTVALDVAGPLDAVPAVVSREGYRIIQEGLTNAARHAGRVPVTLRMAVADGVLAIDITNPVTNRATGRRHGGRGLNGMRERVELLGGQFRVGTAQLSWRVAVTLPLDGPVRSSGPA
jgi:signal transduction histidine kinase